MTAAKKVAYSAIVGGVLAEERELRSVTQGAAATAAGVTQSTWARLEAGKACTLENLGRACATFGLELWQLFKVVDDRARALREQGIEVVYEPMTDTDETVTWIAGNELSRISTAALAATSPLASVAIAAGNGVVGYIKNVLGRAG
ncbi:helix-turn-helix domain-containing protein [Burkholderia sp. Ac-20365]|uniref:helix-turn-helix domain-containing protein n=1 Tax=Burkholderia sp. Ac-20365 TaxID=2703897 RepID=UPI00197C8D39|nr:helix-turn-helix domain-containing protein [Burkholderia sp. Ac-20365]MBN3761134.1 helix-turn-helix domain-containing protein [Burkholderia sp. Ac-20365]